MALRAARRVGRAVKKTARRYFSGKSKSDIGTYKKLRRKGRTQTQAKSAVRTGQARRGRTRTNVAAVAAGGGAVAAGRAATAKSRKRKRMAAYAKHYTNCLLYTSPSPRD